MTVAVSTILERCRLQLMDDTNVRWTTAELLGYINDAQREIVNYKPDAIVNLENLICASDSKQSLPVNAIRLLTVTRNNGGVLGVADNTSLTVGKNLTGGTSGATAVITAKIGTTKLLLSNIVGTFGSGSATETVTDDNGSPGSSNITTAIVLYKRSIRPVSRETLDRFVPTWHGSTATPEVQHFIFDEDDPKNFFVYPPNNGEGQIEVRYTKHPSTVTESSSLEVSDAYANCVIDYSMYRALGKDGDVQTSAARSAVYYQAFMAGLTGKQAVDIATSPRVQPMNVPAARQVPVQ